MRGIGKGQTITMLTPPTVLALVSAQAALGAGKSEEARAIEAADLTTELAMQRQLCDVAAWLHCNTMRTEEVQHSLLCEQSCANVWRKKAFRQLVETHSLEASRKKLFSSEDTRACMAVFRDRIDHSVQNELPAPEATADKVCPHLHIVHTHACPTAASQRHGSPTCSLL